MTVRSPFWRLWTFPFEGDDREVAAVEKRWPGALNELFTDEDRLRVRFLDPSLTDDDRTLLVAGAVFIDLQYLETKAGDRRGSLLEVLPR